VVHAGGPRRGVGYIDLKSIFLRLDGAIAKGAGNTISLNDGGYRVRKRSINNGTGVEGRESSLLVVEPNRSSVTVLRSTSVECRIALPSMPWNLKWQTPI
jgi:hypothetical protein